MTEWISVKDRLPDKLQACLVYCTSNEFYGEGPFINIATFNVDGEFDDGGYIVNVFYWMPLPEPPQQYEG